DLLILHQLPSKIASKNATVAQLLSQLKPTLFVLGSQSDLNLFNGVQEVLGISSPNSKVDLIQAHGNPSFKRFPVSDEMVTQLSAFSPIMSPFGDYRKSTGSEIVLYQQVGTIKTDRPLLILNTNV